MEPSQTKFFVELLEFPNVDLADLRETLLDRDYLRQAFKGQAQKYESAKGCYIFGVRAGRGITPLYVGQTKSKGGFFSECFTDSTLRKTASAARGYDKGTAVLFLIIHGKSRGPANGRAITELEKTLIDLAYWKNPNLANKQGIKEDLWFIEGITGGKGRKSKQTQSFAKMIDFAD